MYKTKLTWNLIKIYVAYFSLLLVIHSNKYASALFNLLLHVIQVLLCFVNLLAKRSVNVTTMCLCNTIYLIVHKNNGSPLLGIRIFSIFLSTAHAPIFFTLTFILVFLWRSFPSSVFLLIFHPPFWLSRHCQHFYQPMSKLPQTILAYFSDFVKQLIT